MPARFFLAIRIGKATKRVFTQNIVLAFGVKGIVLILGAGGLVTLWESVFADLGVALAIVNAARIRSEPCPIPYATVTNSRHSATRMSRSPAG